MSGFDNGPKGRSASRFASLSRRIKPHPDTAPTSKKACRDHNSDDVNNKIDELSATIAGANEHLLRIITHLVSSNAFDELDKEQEAIALIEQQYGRKFDRNDLPLVWSIVEYVNLMSGLRDANAVQ